MATLNAKIVLTSTDASSNALDLTYTDVLSVTNPQVNISRVSVATSGQYNVLTTADNAAITYVYLNNVDTSNIITVKLDDGTSVMDLGPTEWAFLPVKGAVGLEATANTSACVLEFGYWTKS